MQTIIAAIAVALVLGAAAAALLNNNQKRAYEAYSTSGARVSEPGHNLVGTRWTGNI